MGKDLPKELEEPNLGPNGNDYEEALRRAREVLAQLEALIAEMLSYFHNVRTEQASESAPGTSAVTASKAEKKEKNQTLKDQKAWVEQTIQEIRDIKEDAGDLLEEKAEGKEDGDDDSKSN